MSLASQSHAIFAACRSSSSWFVCRLIQLLCTSSPKILPMQLPVLSMLPPSPLALLQSWSTFLLQQCIASRECVLGNISFCDHLVGWGSWEFFFIDCSFGLADGPVLVLIFFLGLRNSASHQLSPMPFIT